MKFYLFSASALIVASCASAQSTDSQDAAAAAQTPPQPPCQEEIYRAFDFWLGEWEVFGRNNEGELIKGGDNKISVQENGCLILEEWTDVRGGTGQSYNFYDPGMEKWRQVWVSGFGTIDYAGGLNDEGAMVLEGDIAYRAGTKARFRGTWTLEDDGSVTQYFQQYDADDEKWVDWFTGIYRKLETTETD